MKTSQNLAAFVSGASSGIGHAIATKLLERGYEVWGTARARSRLSGLESHGRFHPIELDLGDLRGAQSVFLAAADSAGGFDVVVNNAGHGLFGALNDISLEQWNDQLNAMLNHTMALIRMQVASLTEADRGVLVNVSSLAVEFPLPYMSGYNVAKAGLSALSESLMMELKDTAVGVIDFRPGDYRTRFNEAMETVEGTVPRVAPQQAVWRVLESNLQAGPPPEKAAEDLWRAIAGGRRGIVRSGSFFQATLAPCFIRFCPQNLARAIRWRYFGLR